VGNAAVVLVDTSVWIAHFRFAGTIERHVSLGDVATCPPVIQEVLQGIRDEHLFASARETLLASTVLESPMSIDLFEQAAQIYRTGRATGHTIRSAHDCLIAASAIRNGVPLLHSDRDFETIARFTTLQSRYVLP
jgi:predicted nucleic acid-binding protein